MYAKLPVRLLVVSGIILTWTFASTIANAQDRRSARQNTIHAPAAPMQASGAPSESGEQAGQYQRQQGRTERLIRGHDLLGMTIWGPNHERYGKVKDFIVDYREGCPVIYFAMAPEFSGFNDQYVIVPFDAFRMNYDERQRREDFVLDIPVDNLRRAPHIQVNRWDSLNDRQPFTESANFYKQVERKAAKPTTDENQGNRSRMNQGQEQGQGQGQRQGQGQSSNQQQQQTPTFPKEPGIQGGQGGQSGQGGQGTTSQNQPTPPTTDQQPSHTQQDTGKSDSSKENKSNSNEKNNSNEKSNSSGRTGTY